MKTSLKRVALLLAITWSLLGWNTTTKAIYGLPGVERWLNRDPLGEGGFEVFRHLHNLKQWNVRTFRRFAEIKGMPDLYQFVRNSPVSRIDLLGLELADNSCGCADLARDCVTDYDHPKLEVEPTIEEEPSLPSEFLLNILIKLAVEDGVCYGNYLSCIYKCHHPLPPQLPDSCGSNVNNVAPPF